jgi:hypothetical protein
MWSFLCGYLHFHKERSYKVLQLLIPYLSITNQDVDIKWNIKRKLSEMIEEKKEPMHVPFIPV